MNNQEAFDKAANHLLAQGCRSVNEHGACQYRGPNGLKCAVGALIPDDEYRPDMEGHPVENLRAPSLDGVDLDLLDELRQVHDDEHDPENWPCLLRALAKSHYNLSTANVPGLHGVQDGIV